MGRAGGHTGPTASRGAVRTWNGHDGKGSVGELAVGGRQQGCQRDGWGKEVGVGNVSEPSRTRIWRTPGTERWGGGEGGVKALPRPEGVKFREFMLSQSLPCAARHLRN